MLASKSACQRAGGLADSRAGWLAGGAGRLTGLAGWLAGSNAERPAIY